MDAQRYFMQMEIKWKWIAILISDEVDSKWKKMVTRDKGYLLCSDKVVNSL